MGGKVSSLLSCCRAANTPRHPRGKRIKDTKRSANNHRHHLQVTNNHRNLDAIHLASSNHPHQNESNIQQPSELDDGDETDCLPPPVPPHQTHHLYQLKSNNSQSTIPDTRDLPTLSSITSKLDSFILTSPTSIPSVSTSCTSTNLQHISEREPEDIDCDPSSNARMGPLFMQKMSRSNPSQEMVRCLRDRNKSYRMIVESRKKFSSSSTIYLDDSTVSHPNLKIIIKSVSQAIHCHVDGSAPSSRSTKVFEIFDERLHPLTRDSIDVKHHHYQLATTCPDHRSIYRFMRTLFNAAQLPPECAIITLVYVERLLTYAETSIDACSWKRIVLGAILLASKVWDDQAVWNIDYCQILRDINVEDMNELERQFLELLQFNINVPQGVYAKYYFDLRTFSDPNDLPVSFLLHPLERGRSLKMEAMSSWSDEKALDLSSLRKWSSLESLAQVGHRRSRAILS